MISALDPIAAAPAGPVPGDAVSVAVLGPGIEDRAGEWIDAAAGPWRYLLVFVLAAVPLLEVLVVVPIGVALGLDPVLVAVFAFAGNALPIYGLVVAYERAFPQRSTRSAETESARRARARRIWERYGLAGLAALAPVATGVHLAAIIALGLGARGRPTLFWMTLSIAAWTAVVTAASVAGASLLGALA